MRLPLWIIKIVSWLRGHRIIEADLRTEDKDLLVQFGFARRGAWHEAELVMTEKFGDWVKAYAGIGGLGQRRAGVEFDPKKAEEHNENLDQLFIRGREEQE